MIFDDKTLARFCAKNDITRLRLFGSAARGEVGEGSDIDLLVDFGRRKSLLDQVRIERELSALVGRPVDLLTERALSPHLRERILEGARVVYERAA
jgi:uncharacterized protein